MDKRYFIELTNKLYRLTLLFPKKEALRQKIRGVADEILIDLVIILDGEPKERREAAFNVERNIEILDVLFELAKKQDWVLNLEIEEIQDEYLIIKKEVEDFNNISRREIKGDDHKEEKILTREKTLPERRDDYKDEKLNERQEQIVSFIKDNEQVQVKDVQKIFPKVTKRTLRRDLNFLLEKGFVQRFGKANSTYYSFARTSIGQR